MAGAAEKYFLKTDRLGFRNWTKDDLDLARELWGDLEVTKFFGGPFSEEEIRRRFKREMARRLVHGFQYWVIELLETGSLSGFAGCGPTGRRKKWSSWDFICGRNSGGAGWRPKRRGRRLRMRLRLCKPKKLAAGHHPENLNSKKVIEKLGFRYSHQETVCGIGDGDSVLHAGADRRAEKA